MDTLEFAPNHLVDNTRVRLNDLNHLGRNVFFYVGGDGDAVVALTVHRNGGADCLQKAVFVNTGEDEASLVKRLGALGRGADANGGEGMSDRGEEGAFLGERTAVRNDGKSVHL